MKKSEEHISAFLKRSGARDSTRVTFHLFHLSNS
jgi:hypothetical protein